MAVDTWAEAFGGLEPNTSPETLVAVAVANADYDMVGSVEKCKNFVTALRQLRIQRPRSVTIGGNPVSFEDLMNMLATAEAWLASQSAANASQAVNGNGSQSNYYDLSDIRR